MTGTADDNHLCRSCGRDTVNKYSECTWCGANNQLIDAFDAIRQKFTAMNEQPAPTPEALAEQYVNSEYIDYGYHNDAVAIHIRNAFLAGFALSDAPQLAAEVERLKARGDNHLEAFNRKVTECDKLAAENLALREELDKAKDSFSNLRKAYQELSDESVDDSDKIRAQAERIKQLEAEVTRLKIENDPMNRPHP